MKNQFLRRQPDITGDLPEKQRSKISSFVDWNRRAPAIRVTVLNMRAALTDRDKTKSFKQTANLCGFENGERTHR